jgi:hypothetical protein
MSTIARTWQIRYQKLKVIKAQERGDGDEIYLVFIGFRSRFKTPGSTNVFWSGNLGYDWAKHVGTGSERAIPQDMGTVTFENIIRPTMQEIVNTGQIPEILGVIGIAMESDSTSWSAIRSIMNKVVNAVHIEVKNLIEGGNIDLQNPNPSFNQAAQNIKKRVEPTTWNAIKLWIGSWGDPDDIIGIKPMIYVAVDPSLKQFTGATKLTDVAILDQGNFQVDFVGDGAAYRVFYAVEPDRIDAAIDGQGSFKGKAYFFKGDQYIRYDWENDKVDDGPLRIADHWHGFPPGFSGGFDAILNGGGSFSGNLYFFKGEQYVRYNWATDKVEDGPLRIADHWHGLPSGFTGGFDAAVNGQGAFKGKAYFFKGDQYIRYDWATDKVEDGPLRIADNWHGFPPGFTGGFDAILNGGGSFLGNLYFFKGEQYVRYNWATDKVEDGPLRIADHWQGIP